MIILINQALYLETHVFRDINSLCRFEESIPYLYVNKANKTTKALLNEILKMEIKRN